MSSTQRYCFLLMLPISVIGCSRSATVPIAQSPDPTTTPGVIQNLPRATQRWILKPELQHLKISSIRHVTIRSGQNITDSVSQYGFFTITISPLADQFLLTGTADSIKISTGPRINAAEGSIQLSSPIAFTGRANAGHFIIEPVQHIEASQCSSSVTFALGIIHQVSIVLPVQLQAGLTWQDSSVTISCHGSIPVSSRISRTYLVTGESVYDSNPVIVLEENGRISSTGEGSDGQHKVIMTGQGTSRSKFYFDKETGLFRGGNGGQTSTITITTSGRKETFLQLTREVIIARSDPLQ